MRTIKLVIIGNSGVGKTSLRNKYISGRFSTSYRATIGTDFITKVLPHHSKPGEAVTLQIWDTAGQERFSSLSTAFFRGADAVMMMYDVNTPATLLGLQKWWKEFQVRAPVPDEEAVDYCCVVVGNKIDIAEEAEGGRKMAVSEEDVWNFLEQLIPTSSSLAASMPACDDVQQVGDINSSNEEGPHVPNGNGFIHLNEPDDASLVAPPKPIDIRFSGQASNRQPSVSRATSRSRHNGTMTTTRTGVSVYHTPSSSFFDEFVSAPSSPTHSHNPSAATLRTPRQGNSPPPAQRRTANISVSSTSATIRPTSTSPSASTLDRGPKLFLASAKSGYAVSNIFEYIARRVVAKWEWEEHLQDQSLDMTAHSSVIRSIQVSQSKGDTGTCCS